MINEIHILKTITETHWTVDYSWLLIGIVLGVISLICFGAFVVGIYDFIKKRKIQDIGSWMVLTVVFSVMIFLSIASIRSYYLRTQYITTKYKATIDDTVKYNEFVNRYDVLEQNGDIYLIQEKDIRNN